MSDLETRIRSHDADVGIVVLWFQWIGDILVLHVDFGQCSLLVSDEIRNLQCLVLLQDDIVSHELIFRSDVPVELDIRHAITGHRKS